MKAAKLLIVCLILVFDEVPAREEDFLDEIPARNDDLRDHKFRGPIEIQPKPKPKPNPIRRPIFSKPVKPTYSILKTIKALIAKKFTSDMSLQPAALRLNFHDCVGPSCDGCVDFGQGYGFQGRALPISAGGQNPTGGNLNKGLEGVVRAYEALMRDNSIIRKHLSRADLWALGGIVAVEIGMKKAGTPLLCVPCQSFKSKLMSHSCDFMTFEWGRKDCSGRQPTVKFPHPGMTRTEMLDYFDDQFGFTPKEVTVLMGAHTLGKARLFNSGFNGSWVEGEEHKFNTKFYSFLASSSLSFDNHPNAPGSSSDKKFQFNLHNTAGQRVGMMLNTDMELMYDIDVHPLTGTSCKINAPGPACPTTSTTNLVKDLDGDENQFTTEFRKVFRKMLNHGSPKLIPITCIGIQSFDHVKFKSKPVKGHGLPIML